MKFGRAPAMQTTRNARRMWRRLAGWPGRFTARRIGPRVAIACLLTLGGGTLHADVMLEDRAVRPLGADRSAKGVSDADWQLQREILEHAVMVAPDSSWQLELTDPRNSDPRRAATLVPPEIIWRDVLDNAQARPTFPFREDTGVSRGVLAAAAVASLLLTLLIVALRRRMWPANVGPGW
jgi:hypothetical protein